MATSTRWCSSTASTWHSRTDGSDAQRQRCFGAWEEPMDNTGQPFEHPVLSVLDEMGQLVRRKAEDYAATSNVFENFEHAASVGNCTVDQVFNVLIGTKVARLRNLDERGGLGNFESVEDTLIDLANYAALRVAYDREVRGEYA